MENDEKKVQEEKTINAKGGLILLAGVYIIGCFVGAASNSKKINEAYSKGVSDTLEKIIFRLER